MISLAYGALGQLIAFKDGPAGTVIDGYSYDATGSRLIFSVNFQLGFVARVWMKFIVFVERGDGCFS